VVCCFVEPESGGRLQLGMLQENACVAYVLEDNAPFFWVRVKFWVQWFLILVLCFYQFHSLGFLIFMVSMVWKKNICIFSDYKLAHQQCIFLMWPVEAALLPFFNLIVNISIISCFIFNPIINISNHESFHLIFPPPCPYCTSAIHLFEFGLI